MNGSTLQTPRSLRLSAVFIALAVLAGLLALARPASAQVGPEINLMNPSTHSDELSDKPANNTTYRLNAWASNVGAYAGNDAAVEFDLLSTSGDPVVTGLLANRVASDTFEREWDIPQTVDDGPYLLFAYLYTDDGSGYVFRSTDSRAVTVSHGVLFGEDTGNAAEAVDITYPVNGGPAAYYDPPTANASFLIDTKASAGATWTINSFTTSAPGSEPTWTACSSPNQAGGTSQSRCLLPDGVNPDTVTGLASVANDTPRPPGGPPPNPTANDSGDAVRIFPYAQVPTTVTLTPESQDAATGTCASATILVQDQVGRRVAGVNFDVHAQGPTDQLNFDTSGTTPAVTAPDTGGHNAEPGSDCSGTEDEPQGNHPVLFPNPDIKHVEGTTANNGQKTFKLYSDAAGLTKLVAYADLDDDDEGPNGPEPGEPSDNARIRWDFKLAIDPTDATAQRSSCQRFVVTATEGASNVPVVGANIDVHITGPTSAVAFCSPADATAGQTDVVHGDAAGTKHREGPTDSSGKFIFGVTSPTVGETNILAWRDDEDDDMPDGDKSVTAKVTWTPIASRTVGIKAGRYTVTAGRSTRIFGRINGDAACAAFQTVRIQARNAGTTKWNQVKVVTTNDSGRYNYLQKIMRTRDYRAVLPSTGDCDAATSRIIRIRVRR